MADSEWRDVLSIYCWEEVKIVGLLNVSNMTLIPQLIFPKGSRGNKEKVIDLAEGKSRKTIKKIVKTVNDLVLVPAAIIAVMTL